MLSPNLGDFEADFFTRYLTAQAYKLAQHDILTGLPNRSLLNQRLKQILAQAQRDATQVACLFLDFDHWTRVFR